MPKLNTAEGTLTEEARQYLRKALNDRGARSMCCVAPNRQVVDTVSYIGIAQVERGWNIFTKTDAIPVVMAMCTTCGHLDYYAMKFLIPDLDEWLDSPAEPTVAEP